jgi:glycosyltransferase involved in cell wall biosynthesis
MKIRTMKQKNRDSIHILQVIYTINVGGIEKWLVDVLRHIDRDRFCIDFLVHCLYPCSSTEEIRALDSRIILCPHPRKYVSQPWLYERAFKQILHDYGSYDIIHSHTAHFNGYILRLAHQVGIPIRIAHSHHDTTWSDAQEKLHRRLYISWTKSLIHKHATLGLGVSRKAANYMFSSAWEEDSRWQLHYCGIDLTPFQKLVNSAVVRAELGIPADAFVVGHVGRAVKQKNLPFVIEIAAELIKLQPKMYLLLVGDGEMRLEIEQKVAKLGLSGRVIFTGFRTDIPRLMMGAMDVFLFPSLYEGLGLVLIEAQAAKLPCIISDVVPEEADVVKPLVKRISLLAPASEWAKSIIDVKNSTSSILQTEALASVEKSDFNIQIGVKKLSDIYELNFHDSKFKKLASALNLC